MSLWLNIPIWGIETMIYIASSIVLVGWIRRLLTQRRLASAGVHSKGISFEVSYRHDPNTRGPRWQAVAKVARPDFGATCESEWWPVKTWARYAVAGRVLGRMADHYVSTEQPVETIKMGMVGPHIATETEEALHVLTTEKVPDGQEN